MSRRTFAPADALVLAGLLALNLLAWLPRAEGRPARFRITSPAGARVVEPGAGRVEVEGPLGLTVIEVGERAARVVESPCPLKLCIRAGAVDRPGRVAACLPNRVALEAVGPGGDVDAVGR